MTTHENAPPPADWRAESRPCPIPCSACEISETPTHSAWLHGTDTLPPLIELGEN